MENIRALHPKKELDEFFTFMYEDEKGFVYSPTKHPQTEEWTTAFFEWPEAKSDLIEHVLANTGDKEVYFAPALFVQPSPKKEHVKGSYVIWAEFDGNAPDAYADLPIPSMKLRSSEIGHEHVYWRLDYFEVDVNKIEAANRGLAYRFNADTSGWDANQILRPVGTINHKREKNVQLLVKNASKISVDIFDRLPAPLQLVQNILIENVPQALSVVAKYSWDAEAFEFFTKKDIPVGSRSSAMMRLGFYCTEMKMTDEEAYSILANADDRWGKFSKRSDRKRRLLDIINKARLKYPLDNETELLDEFDIYNFETFMAHESKLEWVIPGVLQRAGSLMLSGPPGTGKTQLTLQFAIHMAIGKPFLDWKIERPHKIVFFSLEMGHSDLKYFFDYMAVTLTKDELVLLRENLFIIPQGYPISLDTPLDQRRVTRVINKHLPDGVIFDSLGSVTNEELSSEKITKTIFDYIDRTRANNDLFVWFIHHNRKAQVNNKKPNTLSDIYGSQYITAKPTTVIGLWPEREVGVLTITGLKVRLAKPFQEFRIKRDDNLNFKLLATEAGAGLLNPKKVIEIIKEVLEEDDGLLDI